MLDVQDLKAASTGDKPAAPSADEMAFRNLCLRFTDFRARDAGVSISVSGGIATLLYQQGYVARFLTHNGVTKVDPTEAGMWETYTLVDDAQDRLASVLAEAISERAIMHAAS